MSLNKGICYQPFPPGYDPSRANTTCLYFGSDIAYDPMAPLWGNNYQSSKGSACGGTGSSSCRNDLQTLHGMGVDLIRLYDWEPRNYHLNFLDYCNTLGLKVLVPVSNYFVKPSEGLPKRDSLIPALLKSFSNKEHSDYHSAVAGIIIGNEPEINNFDVQNCIDFTKTWVDIEQSQFSGYREVQIGHPVDFGLYGGQYPCWGFWDPLLAALNQVTTRNLSQRLFLAPQTYNTRAYLFENAESSGKGYVDLTYEQYQKPILFTEIGHDRTKPDYQSVVDGQLAGCLAYDKQQPGRLMGMCFFQFADKVWIQGTSEGSFGAFSHGNTTLCTITYGPDDFTHWDVGSCDGEQMTVDQLNRTPLYDIVVKNYTAT
jgi:hypothetical protein